MQKIGVEIGKIEFNSHQCEFSIKIWVLVNRYSIIHCFCANMQKEHRKRWQEYRSSHSSTDDSSQSHPLSERDIRVQGNLTGKGRVYGFGAEGVVMKQRSHLLVSSRSSSINKYDARLMAMRLNESAVKAAEKARQAEEAR